MPMSSVLSNALAALITENTKIDSFSGSQRFLALHTENPTALCTTGELSGMGYARTLIPLASVDGSNGNDISNSGIIIFPVGTGDLGSLITHFSIWDSVADGSPLTYGELAAPINWQNGISISLATNAFLQIVENKK